MYSSFLGNEYAEAAIIWKQELTEKKIFFQKWNGEPMQWPTKPNHNTSHQTEREAERLCGDAVSVWNDRQRNAEQ